MDIVPLAEAKAHLSELLNEVEKQHNHFIVTRNGRAAAVVVSMGEWESLNETLAVLSNRETVEAIRQAEEDIERGDVYTTEEVLAALEARRQRSA